MICLQGLNERQCELCNSGQNRFMKAGQFFHKATLDVTYVMDGKARMMTIPLRNGQCMTFKKNLTLKNHRNSESQNLEAEKYTIDEFKAVSDAAERALEDFKLQKNFHGEFCLMMQSMKIFYLSSMIQNCSKLKSQTSLEVSSKDFSWTSELRYSTI